MSVSPERLTANQANARLSTGPTTDEGKAASSQNALKHGLTGKTVVLPTEDQNEFQRFCAEIIAALEPSGPVEFEFAQIVAHSQWRMKRVKAIEDGLLGFGHFGPTAPFTQPQTLEDSEAIARSFMENRKAFANLSQYENRLYRTMTNALKQLKDLQAARQKHEEEIAVAAKALFNHWVYTSDNFRQPDDDAESQPAAEPPAPEPATTYPPDPQPEPITSGHGFVFSTLETDSAPPFAPTPADCNNQCFSV